MSSYLDSDNIDYMRANKLVLEKLNRADKRFIIHTDYILSDPSRSNTNYDISLDNDLWIDSAHNNIVLRTKSDKSICLFGNTNIKNHLDATDASFSNNITITNNTITDNLFVNNESNFNYVNVNGLTINNNLTVNCDDSPGSKGALLQS